MASQFMGAILGVVGVFVLAVLAYYVLCVVGRWKVFQKMGEPGWKALIPIYSDYIIYKRCWNPWMYLAVVVAVLATVVLTGYEGVLGRVADIASLVALLINAISCYRYSVCFGHGAFFAIGLYFLNPIFTIILGFGDSFYHGNVYNRYF